MKEVVSHVTFDNRYIFSGYAGNIRKKSQIVRKKMCSVDRWISRRKMLSCRHCLRSTGK